MGARSGGRTGRPPLTERRREATRREIAEHALRLFAAQGVAATTAEDIAAGDNAESWTQQARFHAFAGDLARARELLSQARHALDADPES